MSEYIKNGISIGDKFGEWTVIGDAKHLSNRPALSCQCSCGHIKPIKITDLINNDTTKCRHCFIRKTRLVAVGEIYNNWTIIDEPDVRGRWLCKCECGKISRIYSWHLRKGNSSSCSKGLRIKKDKGPSATFWSQVVHNAKVRNIDITITLEQAKTLLENQNNKCKLSGLPIYLSITRKEHRQRCTTASLDRIDSSKGYTLDNVQWVHKDVNQMKMAVSQDRFIELCKAISLHNMGN